MTDTLTKGATPQADGATSQAQGAANQSGAHINKDAYKEAKDFLPLNGVDHVEFWVGNAKQAACRPRRRTPRPIGAGKCRHPTPGGSRRGCRCPLLSAQIAWGVPPTWCSGAPGVARARRACPRDQPRRFAGVPPSPRAGARPPDTSTVSGPQPAVSPLQHSAWLTPNMGQPGRTHAAWPWT